MMTTTTSGEPLDPVAVAPSYAAHPGVRAELAPVVEELRQATEKPDRTRWQAWLTSTACRSPPQRVGERLIRNGRGVPCTAGGGPLR